jgi:aminoglycoside 6'-N-acetyltransferase I
MTLSVRRATSADLDAALPLLQRFFAEEGFATPPDLIRERLGEMLADLGTGVFLAWLGTEAVGVATVTTSSGIEFGLGAELEDLYVRPDVRERGVGSALIEAVIAWCRARACTVVEVVVTPEGQAAHDLIGYYRARGFRESGRVMLLLPLTGKEQTGEACPPLPAGPPDLPSGGSS